MDIHKPKPAHSLREFAVEIGTITVGILIALSLEAAVQAWHNHELVHRARVDLRQELLVDRQTLLSEIAQDKAAARSLDAFRRYDRDRMNGMHRSPSPSLDLTMTFIPLSTSAWESTVATQALIHMSYDEAHALTRVYAATRVYDDYQQQASKEWFELSTFADDPASLSDADVSLATRAIIMNQAYLASLAVSGSHLLTVYDQAIAALRSPQQQLESRPDTKRRQTDAAQGG